MNRLNAVLAVLAGVMILVLFWFFLWRPKTEEIEEIRTQIETAQTRQATLRTRIAALEEVRARAPEIEAGLVAAESIIPRDVALPSTVRSLQLAAQDSGVSLVAVNPTRPQQFSEEIPELAVVPLAVQVEGGYFQIVDFLRRIEDPAITPRGVEWNSLTLSELDYPVLSGLFSGELYAVLPAPPVIEEPAPAPSPSPGATPSPSPSPGGES